MQNIAAREAKLHFGKMLDSAQREPVLIKKHGRPFAVVLSAVEYEQLKMTRLRAELAIGEEQARRGEFADPGMAGLIAEALNESILDSSRPLVPDAALPPASMQARARKVKMRFSPCFKINDLRH